MMETVILAAMAIWKTTDRAEKDAEDRVADDKSYGRAGGYFTYIS